MFIKLIHAWPTFVHWVSINPVSSVIAGWITAFVFGIAVKKPITAWWKNRGELRKIREEIYERLGELFRASHLFVRLMETFSESGTPGGYAEAIRIFYVSANPVTYRRTFRNVDKVRTKMRGEAAAVQRILALLEALPGANAGVKQNRSKIPVFVDGLMREIATSSLDGKMISKVVSTQAENEIEPIVNGFAYDASRLKNDLETWGKHIKTSEAQLQSKCDEYDAQIARQKLARQERMATAIAADASRHENIA